jgi:hypothetical protein
MIDTFGKRLLTDKRFRHRVVHSILDHAIFLLTASAVCGALALLFRAFGTF